MSEESSSVAVVHVPKADDPGRSSYDESLEILGVFTDRVAALDADAWTRITERCAPLNGSSFEALIERAFVAESGSAIGMIEPQTTAGSVFITSVRVAMAAFALANEVALEFDAPASPAERPTPSGRPRLDAMLDADWKIESALHRSVPGQRGVAVAMSVACHAIQFSRWMTDARFAELYAFIEPEIPFESVKAEHQAMRKVQGHAAADAVRSALRKRQVDRFIRFVDRLERLTPEAWDRINQRCAHLNGSSFEALLDRVAFRTRSVGGWRRNIARKESWSRRTKTLVTAFVATTAFVNEIVHEFEPEREPRAESTERLARLDPERRRSIDAFDRMRTMIREHAPGLRGTDLAITAAARVVQWPRTLTTQEIAALYAAVEPEIPFAELEQD